MLHEPKEYAIAIIVGAPLLISLSLLLTESSKIWNYIGILIVLGFYVFCFFGQDWNRNYYTFYSLAGIAYVMVLYSVIQKGKLDWGKQKKGKD
ncbi:hypothetical protein [Methanolapillus millepedarum]|uniref:Uncharacterized protein n=1 Tax=Methanolapillus millepedarum TaxID=3028296 RepID=A0AA96ZWF0_9EURY|nr:hypothetical protein MsAc7_14470 [Methanosarcinaceae archaeon Ac7]